MINTEVSEVKLMAIEVDYYAPPGSLQGDLMNWLAELMFAGANFVEDFRSRHSELQPSPFLDHVVLGNSYLGQLSLAVGTLRQLADHQAFVHAAYLSSHECVLQFRVESLHNLPETLQQLNISQEEWMGRLENELDQLITPHGVEKVATWSYFVAPSLTQITGLERLEEWEKGFLRQTEVKGADLFCDFESPDRTIVYRYLMPGDFSTVEYRVYSEIELVRLQWGETQFAQYYHLLQAVVHHARDELGELYRDTLDRLKHNRNSSSFGLVKLVAAFNPFYRDRLDPISDLIAQLNHARLASIDHTAKIESNLQVFHLPYRLLDGRLILFRETRFIKGLLLRFDDGAIKSMKFSEYNRQLGLRLGEFYMADIGRLSERIRIQLDYIKLESELRDERRGNILNQILLLLAFISIVLAALQVATAYDSWRPQVGMIFLVSCVIFFLAVICSNIYLKYQVRQQTKRNVKTQGRVVNRLLKLPFIRLFNRQ